MPELKILGGQPAFDVMQPITRPTMPDYATVEPRLRAIYASGMVTLDKNVRELETRVAEYLGVRHVVATSSNSTGQMLVLRALGLKGEVIVPSFSFCMSSHVLLWCGLEPVFVDCDEATCTVDPKRVEEAITPRTVAILGVHIWGNPCRADELREIARRRGLRFITDAAQAMGSSLNGRKTGGLADAEVFSCSPTKILTCGEGGLVATNDDDIAAKVRKGRVYGLNPDYTCDLVGVNARMSEMNAALGVASFEALEKNMAARRARFAQYRALVGAIPGVTLPQATPGAEPNGQYFAFYVDADRFGLTRDELYKVLALENIMPRKYFDPPLHKLAVNRDARRHDLSVTERMCARVLSVPLYSHSTPEMIATISDAIARAQRSAGRVREALQRQPAAA